ncbi:outer membrane protein transport protein [Aestuariibius insulae]|uniref:outer membrane protein transport protein n=1 Tax=Aestuariibius insulae TaxID=2058287 RepID=UPI00345E25F5
MKRVFTVGAALMMTASAVSAAGIERNRLSYSTMYEPGDYLELQWSTVSTDVTGDYDDDLAALGGSDSTGDMSNDYFSVGLAYKNQLNDQLSLGFFLNRPYGADAQYSQGVYTGLEAEWKSRQAAVLLRYALNSNFSVYGGLRYVESQPDIMIPDILVRGAAGNRAQELQAEAQAAAAAGDLATAQELGAEATRLGGTALSPTDVTYTARTERDGAVGYVAGVAYERPEIALRVALTYESSLEYEFDTKEVFAGRPDLSDDDTTTEIEMPQTIALDFQTGIAQDTLLFGTIRWSEWSVWEVQPDAYLNATGGRVTGIDDDAMEYTLGVGRRLTEDFSAFVRVKHEPGNGEEASRLAPTDGLTSVGFGGTYNYEDIKLTGGVEFVNLGDAEDSSNTDFSDNSAVAVGLNIGFRF